MKVASISIDAKYSENSHNRLFANKVRPDHANGCFGVDNQKIFPMLVLANASS